MDGSDLRRAGSGAAWWQPGTVPELAAGEIAVLARIAYREAGLHIDASKSAFLIARLAGRLAALGETSFAGYAARLEASSDERRAFVECLTTHTTDFFRERPQYDWLQSDGIRSLWDRGAGRVRDLVVWSAACSTGQELYSAIMVLDLLGRGGLRGLRFRGIGTDISGRIVERAAAGIFRREEIRNIPAELRETALLVSRRDPEILRISGHLRARTEWRQANLCIAGELGEIRCDVAFVRNVLIYFDPPMRRRILQNVVSRIGPGGYLLTGHSEPVAARELGLVAIRPSVYRKEA